MLRAPEQVVEHAVAQTAIVSIPSASNTAQKIATPPGSTAARLSRSPGMRFGSARSCLSSSDRSFCNPSCVIPVSAYSFSRRISSIARAVPEEPTASSHPSPLYSRTIPESSWRAASSALRNPDLSIFPSGK
jgi:hypothetical protein